LKEPQIDMPCQGLKGLALNSVAIPPTHFSDLSLLPNLEGLSRQFELAQKGPDDMGLRFGKANNVLSIISPFCSPKGILLHPLSGAEYVGKV